jgi:hypothetical protein
MLQKTVPPLAVVTVDIGALPKLASAELDAQDNQIAYKRALVTFADVSKYSPASYDTNWLAQETLQKIHAAQTIQSTSIQLENRCCVIDGCPQITFRKIFIDELKK